FDEMVIAREIHKKITNASECNTPEISTQVKNSEELLDLVGLPLIATCLSFNHLERDDFELEFEDLVDEKLLEYSWSEQMEILRHDSLKKLGWTRTTARKSRMTQATDDVLYWPGFVPRALPLDAQDIDSLLSRGTARLTKQELNAAIDDFDQ